MQLLLLLYQESKTTEVTWELGFHEDWAEFVKHTRGTGSSVHKGVGGHENTECLQGRVVGLQRRWRGFSEKGEQEWEVLLRKQGSGCERH